MESEKNDERKFFENIMESIRAHARTAGIKYVKELNIDRLPEKEKADCFTMHINLVSGNLRAIDRMEYCNLDNDQLWELFKSRGLLDDAKEIQKLKDVMGHSEIFKLLNILKLEFNGGHEARKGTKTDHELPNGKVDVDELNEVLKAINEEYHLVAAPSTLHDFLKAALCHDWSSEKDPIFVACMTTVLKCVVDCVKRFNPDFNYANIGRCKLFISKCGHYVSAHDLSTSVSEKPNTQLKIESYFARLRKRH